MEPLEGAYRSNEEVFNCSFINLKKGYNFTLVVYNITFVKRGANILFQFVKEGTAKKWTTLLDRLSAYKVTL